MPFITEKLWNKMYNKSSFLMNEVCKDISIQEKFNTSQKSFKDLIQIVISIRNLRSELNISYKDKIILNIINDNEKFILFIKNLENQIIKLLKLESLLINDRSITSHGSANIISSSSTLIVPLKGIIDTNKEIEKLNTKKNKEVVILKQLENKLNNINFIDKAPESIILQFKKQVKEVKSSIVKIDQIINTIN